MENTATTMMHEMETLTFSRLCNNQRSMQTMLQVTERVYEAFTEYLYGGDSDAMEADAKKFGTEFANAMMFSSFRPVEDIQKELHSNVITKMMRKHLEIVFGDRLRGACYLKAGYQQQTGVIFNEDKEYMTMLTITLANKNLVMTDNIRLIASKCITDVSDEEFASVKEWNLLYEKVRSHIIDLVSKILKYEHRIQLIE